MTNQVFVVECYRWRNRGSDICRKHQFLFWVSGFFFALYLCRVNPPKMSPLHQVMMSEQPDFCRRLIYKATLPLSRDVLTGRLLLWPTERPGHPFLSSHAAVSHLSNWSHVDLSGLLKALQWYNLLAVQLSVDACRACLTGGSCRSVASRD